jgi:hypothetical protein
MWVRVRRIAKCDSSTWIPFPRTILQCGVVHIVYPTASTAHSARARPMITCTALGMSGRRLVWESRAPSSAGINRRLKIVMDIRISNEGSVETWQDKWGWSTRNRYDYGH